MAVLLAVLKVAHVAVTIGGSTNLINNGPEDIMSGDLLAWQMPYVDMDNGNPAARNLVNTPHGKPMFQIVPFRATNAKLSLLAIRGALGRDSNVSPQPGIQDINTREKITKALEDSSRLSPLQEEALAMREGFKVLLGEGALAGILANPNSAEFGALQLICDGISGAIQARRDRIIGKAISSAPKGNTVHVMLNHQ